MHQLFPKPFALPILVNANADSACMLAPWSIWKRSDADHAGNPLVDNRYEVVSAVNVFRDSLSPVLARRIRHLKCPFIHLGRGKHLANLFVVVRLGTTYF